MTDALIVNIAHGLTGETGGAARFSGALRIEGGRIADMGDLKARPGEEVIDATGCVVCPGFVNTHHHLFQSLLKAVPAGMNLSLDPWLMHVPFTWWPRFDADSFRVAAEIGFAELALSGATTVCDHHYIYPASWDFDADDILFETAARFGLRFVLARGGGTKGRVFDDPSVPPVPVEPLEAFLDGVMRAADRWHDPSADAMTRVVAAPTTPIFNVEPGELREIAVAARARGLRLHSHLSENRSYVDVCLARHGQRPVDWLEGQGWLGPDVWFAHLVEIDEGEIAALAATGTGMAHCPQANARLGSGIAPAAALHEAGGTVSLAVDGAAANEAADMASALYAGFAMNRAAAGAGALSPETVLHWATGGGAKALGLDAVGRIAPGMAADILLIDLSHPRYMGLHDPTLAPIVSGGAFHLRRSFVAGREIVRDGALADIDLAGLDAAAERATANLIQSMTGASAPTRARAAQA
ncbi:MAG: amidohydrolase family protein [Paracoccaceae bacterium]|nr:amidohydrolase family protein [Paracoccaceae bacterium]